MITRLATTVGAKYQNAAGAVDGFYLDGRFSGKREEKGADITLDREAGGSFFAIYASSYSNSENEQYDKKKRDILDKIHDDMRYTDKKIDQEINDLADCAVNVSGQMTLGDNGVKQPYFAGLIVKDAEIAAVTLGRGCAYLYRNDILYPLTEDEYPLKAVDTHGRKVPNLYVYSAGTAATIRYSNIARLQQDDCFILCSREVMDTIGQENMLQLLYAAEDQADSVGMVKELMDEKAPGVPYQYMIGFVEDLLADKDVKTVIKKAATPTVYEANDNNFGNQQLDTNAAPVNMKPIDDFDDSYDDYEHTGSSKGLIIVASIFACLLAVLAAFLIWVQFFNEGNFPSWVPLFGSSDAAKETSATSPVNVTLEPTTSAAPTTKETTAATTTAATTTAAKKKHPDKVKIRAGQALVQLIQEVYKDYHLDGDQQAAALKALIKANPDKITNNGNNYYAGDELVIPDIDDIVNGNPTATTAGTTATTAKKN
ncbi:hypothetical protein PYS61_05630 [Amygdalobacter indicium]|uniref:LysM domain-containing protein n=1 Tax=Amygdalobacter indicium TaxID=3029272 RepID=A0ABY8C3Z6_9FIRM|nr:hypothetical protein [Amygdalobacter indicium]WEG35408.1 hypothetical protein PYS61_05630 [Amygdalobacter indicium]